jgi:hypothetical protein
VKISAYGIEVDLPEGWDGRIYRRFEGAPILHAANFALPATDGDFGAKAVRRMKDGGVFIVLAEFAPEAAAQPLFRPQGLPLPLSSAEANPRALQRLLPDRAGMQRFFTVNGRPFCLYVVIRTKAEVAATMDQANSVLQSVAIHPGGSV